GGNFALQKDETLALGGESGSGKSVTSNASVRLVRQPPVMYGQGDHIFDGQHILGVREDEVARSRGKDIVMIFLGPMTALNATVEIGHQIREVFKKHRKEISKAEAKKRAIELLRLVGIPYPEERFEQYPHVFSGGMRHRVVIAIALAAEPKLLIADE